MIRVIVADDSATARGAIVDALTEDPDIEVVGEAADGLDAVALVDAHAPDVVTLDMSMPRLDGLGAVESIMATRPTPILIVSASANRSDALTTFDAIAAGAVDLYDKSAVASSPAWSAGLRARVRLLSRLSVVRHIRPRRAGPPVRERAAPAHAPQPVIGIGASTGGPGAVARVLRDLGPIRAPILVVMHIGEPFVRSLAEWLSDATPRGVRLAEGGERLSELATGPVLLAPGARHLVIRRGRVKLAAGPPRHYCIPAVDELFFSLADEAGPAAVGVLLTGMGVDGAAGLVRIRERGGATLAQDEETSVVFGMPGEAIRRGGAQQIVAVGDVGERVWRLMPARREG